MKAPTEKHLEDWIVATNSLFDEREGAELVARQLPLPSGRLDLLYHRFDSVAVAEIKKGMLDTHSLTQVLSYIHDLKRIWKVAIIGMPDPDPSCSTIAHQAFGYWSPQIKGILVGYDIPEDVLLAADASDVEVILYDFRDDGTYGFAEQLVVAPNETFEPNAYGIAGETMRKAYLEKLGQYYSPEEIAAMYRCGYPSEIEL